MAKQRARIQHDPADPRHGTAGGYSNNACRCPRCTAANTAKINRYMHADPQHLERHRLRNAARRARTG